MRILEFTGEPIGTGGQEMFIINVLRNLEIEECVIDWATPYTCYNEKYKQEVQQKGGCIVSFDLPFNPGGNRVNIFSPLYMFLKKNRYDVIHIHSGSISVLTLGALAARLAKVKKIIVHSHSTGLKKDFKYRIIKLLSYPILRFCPTDYCACSMQAAKWKFPKKIVEKRVNILNNGIDLRVFRPNPPKRIEIRESLGLKEEILLGHVGRLSYVKNQKFLLDIVKIMLERGMNVKLLLIGEGEDEDLLKEDVINNNLTSVVFFLGTTTKVYDYMQAMDVFLFPSKWEGLGMVAVEAQAVGIPVIASDNVPKEMDLTNNVSFYSLQDSEKWINKIADLKGKRFDNLSVIQEKGYDIIQTVVKIQTMYKKK